jgi:hypothetical protein
MNALVPANVFGGLTTSTGSDADYAKYAEKKGFLQPLMFSSKGKAFESGKYIPPGNYFVKDGEDAKDLGNSIDVIVLARGRKAIDYSNRDALVVCHDANSQEYQRIEAESGEKESKCMEGPRYLMVERATGQFYELFCASAGLKKASVLLNGFLPTAEAGITGAATLSAQFRKTAYGTQHDPVVNPCSTPFALLPSEERMVEEITKFITAKDSDGKTVAKDKAPQRDR